MIQKSDIVMIKLSPMVDIADCVSKLHNVSEVHIVATDNECKEVLIILQQGYDAEPKIFTVNDNQRYYFLLSSEEQLVWIRRQRYFVDFLVKSLLFR